MKKQPSEVRLSLAGRSGELAPPDPDEVPGRGAARWLFLEVLAEEAPDVVTELYEHVTPLVRPALKYSLSGFGPGRTMTWPDLREPGSSPDADGHAEPEWVHQKRLETMIALRDALLTWGNHWHLSDDWLMDTALQSVLRWARIRKAAWQDPGARPCGHHDLWQRGLRAGAFTPKPAPRPRLKQTPGPLPPRGLPARPYGAGRRWTPEPKG